MSYREHKGELSAFVLETSIELVNPHSKLVSTQDIPDKFQSQILIGMRVSLIGQFMKLLFGTRKMVSAILELR
ncbi:MAG: hypothetical protein CL791_01140 [Chloroflexi bacterium]|nr:hypothetical protein [Chloroflexota bacterium]